MYTMLITSLLIFTTLFLLSFFMEGGCELSNKKVDLSCSFLLTIILSVIFCPFSLMFYSTVVNSNEDNRESYISKEYDIVSLNNGNETSGSFVLGSGHINSIEYYYMFIKIGENRYKRYKVKSRISEIVESDKPPKLIEYNSKLKDEYKGWAKNFEYKSKCIIRIPKDTIIKEFNLN